MEEVFHVDAIRLPWWVVPAVALTVVATAVAVVWLVMRTAVSWRWFAMCFTATYPAWWNSLWVFVAAFAVATALAAVGLFAGAPRTDRAAAIVSCAVSGASLALVLVFAL